MHISILSIIKIKYILYNCTHCSVATLLVFCRNKKKKKYHLLMPILLWTKTLNILYIDFGIVLGMAVSCSRSRCSLCVNVYYNYKLGKRGFILITTTTIIRNPKWKTQNKHKKPKETLENMIFSGICVTPTVTVLILNFGHYLTKWKSFLSSFRKS